MRVRAKQVCFVDGHRRRVGDEFDYQCKLASYMEPVEPVAEPTHKEPPQLKRFVK